MPDTKISFSIGHSYKTAKGEIIRDNINEQILKVAFPNSIYMQIEHPRGESIKTGRFSFEFWYRNQDVLGEDNETVDGDYSLFTEIKGKCKRLKMTYSAINCNVRRIMTIVCLCF